MRSGDRGPVDVRPVFGIHLPSGRPSAHLPSAVALVMAGSERRKPIQYPPRSKCRRPERARRALEHRGLLPSLLPHAGGDARLRSAQLGCGSYGDARAEVLRSRVWGEGGCFLISTRAVPMSTWRACLREFWQVRVRSITWARAREACNPQPNFTEVAQCQTSTI